MKLEIIKNEEGVKTGYLLIPETQKEAEDINFIRDQYFWGMDENVIVYDGRTKNKDFPEDAGNLRFTIKKHVKH